jgi:PAS domain-containing protein
MAPPASPPASGEPRAPAFLDDAFRDILDSIDAPALVFLPGGRIAAVNRAMADLAGGPVPGEAVGAVVDRLRARRADGSPLVRGDLPYARALRGEVVGHGERVELTLADGTVHRAVITSTPVARDGSIVAALSVWHDFGALVRRLAADR